MNHPTERLRSALASGPKPNPPGAVANTLTFAWRALLKIKHTPEQLFDVAVTPTMFTVLFTFMFGGALAGSPSAYLQFLLPGMIVQMVTFTTVYTGFTLNTDISKGVFDRFKSMPLWKPSPIVGAMVGDTIRYTVSAVIVVAIGYIMGYRAPNGVVSVLPAIVLLNVFAFGIGWIFTMVALIMKTPSGVMTSSWLFLMPLTFASNVYVEPTTMPDWLQAFVAVNPVSLAVTAVRGILDGTVTGVEIGAALIAPFLVTAVCGPLAMALYRRER